MPVTSPLPATVCFPLTVEARLSQAAEALLRRECGRDIRAIRLEPLPERCERRLWVTLALTAYSLAVHAVITGLPAAEFGAVRTVAAKFTVDRLAA